MEYSVREPVDRLLKGISTYQVETVRDAWRDLLQDRETSILAVRKKLDTPAWAENPRGPLTQYFGVLLSILDELDSSVFEQEIRRLRSTNLHSSHQRTLNFLSQRIFEQPATHIAESIPVYIASEITDRSVVKRNIERWSETRGLLLDDVTRVDIIALHPEMDYLGKYNLLFSGIILTWPAKPPKGFNLWWQRFHAELTFYHEVGHHVSGHLEGGQVAEQEAEANAYARILMRKSRPVLTCFGRVILWPLKPLIKLIIRRMDLTPDEAAELEFK